MDVGLGFLILASALIVDAALMAGWRGLRRLHQGPGAPDAPAEPEELLVADDAEPRASPLISLNPPRPAELLLFGGGFVLTVLALWLLWKTPNVVVNLIVVAASATFFTSGLLAADGFRAIRWAWGVIQRAAAWLRVAPLQVLMLLFGLTLVLASRAAAGDSSKAAFDWHWVVWFAGAALALAGTWRPPRRRPGQAVDAYSIAWLAALVLVTVAARAVALTSVPFEVNGDEGAGGLTGWEFITGERTNLVTVAWHSFPSFYFWIISLSQRLLGHTLLAVRLPSAIAGSLTVLATYWAARRIFGWREALIASAFLSTYHVQLLFSRIAINNVWDELSLAVLLGTVWVAWKENQRWAFLAAGVAVGLGQYFYPTSHLLPIYAVIWVIILRFRMPAKDRWPGVTAMGLTAVALAAPLALFYVSRPEYLMAPMNAVAVVKGFTLRSLFAGGGQSPLAVIGDQFSATLLGLIVLPVNGIYRPGVPMLLPVPAVLFTAGFVLCLARFKDPRYIILPLMVLGPVLAGTFSMEVPNAQRLQMAAPALALILALPPAEALKRLARAWPALKPAGVVIAALIAIGLSLEDANFFFRHAMPEGGYADRAAIIARDVGDYLGTLPADTPVYFFGDPRLRFEWFPALPYLAGDVDEHDMSWPPAANRPLPPPGTKAVFVFLQEQMGVLPEIEALYPGGGTVQHVDKNQQMLFTAYISGP